VSHPSIYLHQSITYELGFLTGKKKQIIPWGALVKDPTSWISEECVPDGFEWKDPSKIQIGEVFRLLYHWQHRQDQGLDPLIWLPTCPLLQDVEQHSWQPFKLGQHIRQAIAQQPQVSDEEVFDLPLSDEEEDKDISGDSESSDESPIGGDLSDDGESDDLDVESHPIHMSHEDQGSSGEYRIYSANLPLISHVLQRTVEGLLLYRTSIHRHIDHSHQVSILSKS
jgi:hypothetical protein